MPYHCGICGKKTNTLYAMIGKWACESCWKLNENPEYVKKVKPRFSYPHPKKNKPESDIY